MLRNLFLTGCLLAGFTPLHALTKVGTTAMPFLKIGVGARAAAMGEAFVALATDATALYWNPAGLAAQPGTRVFFTHTRWFADARYHFTGMSVALDAYRTLGLSLGYLGLPDEEVTRETAPNGTGEFFSFSDMWVGVAFAQRFTREFSAGLQLKWLQENLWHMQATTFALDVGLRYRFDHPRLTMAASFSNFGGKVQHRGEDTRVLIDVDPAAQNPLVPADLRLGSYELPLRFQMGAAWEAFRTPAYRLTLEGDLVHPNDNSEYVNLGVELDIRGILQLRGGWRGLGMEQSQGGASAGLGLQFGNARLDVAYSDYGPYLKGVQRFALQFAF